MTKRTASEIREYCDAATKGPWVTGSERGFWRLAYHDEDWAGFDCEYQDLLSVKAANAGKDGKFIICARTDLPRLLDAATGLYKIALWLAAQEGRKLTEHEAHEIGSYLNGLAWLADSPEPADSPDGESHALADGKLHGGISTTGQFDD